MGMWQLVALEGWKSTLSDSFEPGSRYWFMQSEKEALQGFSEGSLSELCRVFGPSEKRTSSI